MVVGTSGGQYRYRANRNLTAIDTGGTVVGSGGQYRYRANRNSANSSYPGTPCSPEGSIAIERIETSVGGGVTTVVVVSGGQYRYRANRNVASCFSTVVTRSGHDSGGQYRYRANRNSNTDCLPLRTPIPPEGSIAIERIETFLALGACCGITIVLRRAVSLESE